MRLGKKAVCWILPIVLVCLALVPVLILLWQVEDWSRDLSSNRAETSIAATKESLRPITSAKSVKDLADLVGQTAGSLPGWQVTGKEELEGGLTIKMVRTTRLMCFKDDIQVRIEQLPSGECRINARSQSRVGKADFGQNPRNLAELLDKVRAGLR